MELIKEAIKEKYGYRIPSPLEDKLIVKPSHLYEQDEIDVLIEGVHMEAAEHGVFIDD
ncbi:MAG: hypothetical protein PHQ35_11490 [Phycisphaerae bacterium]|nr:hypothetical protein [Phycisphaerae bacterium]